MSGFGSCSSCAGAGGSGTSASFWMKQGISSPSIDGKATQFFLGGSTPYSDAMWWKRIASNSSSLHHFVYDTYFYYQNSSAVQGLEFNITAYSNSKGYVFGLTCDIRSSGTWKISVPNSSSSKLSDMHWQSTGIACPAPPTYKWNHLQFEAERTSGNQVHYISVTLNGVKHYINTTVASRIAPSTWNGMTTHIQLNGDYKQDDYSVWMDKYNVITW